MSDIEINDKNEKLRLEHNKRNNEYYHNNRVKMLEYQKQKQKEYYEKNKEKIKLRNKENQRKNREILKQYKETLANS